MPGRLPRAGRAGDSLGRKRRRPMRSAPPRATTKSNAMGNRTFKIFLIKPSHYDDDGYVIQWRLSTIPSNSLASVYGLLAACREERALGPDVDIEIDACDECNTVIDVKAISQRIKAAGGGFVGLVGVHPINFPRPLILAPKFRPRAVPL